MSSKLGFLDLPAEIRFMIYRLLFHPSSEAILIGLALASSVGRSAQLLRVCRVCNQEGSPVLYGENQFALDWAYSGIEHTILEFLENIGLRNQQSIRHLRARHSSNYTLDKMRARRSLRPILENLDSLSLEFWIENRSIGAYLQRLRTGPTILQELRRRLKSQRGPYMKLAKAFKNKTDCLFPEDYALSIRLLSGTMKPGPEVSDVDPTPESH
jgi:hypothetical protein